MPKGLRLAGQSGLDAKNLRRPMKSYPVTRSELYNLFSGKGLASVLLAVFSAFSGVLFDNWHTARSAGESWSMSANYPLYVWAGIAFVLLVFIQASTWLTARRIERECIDPEADSRKWE